MSYRAMVFPDGEQVFWFDTDTPIAVGIYPNNDGSAAVVSGPAEIEELAAMSLKAESIVTVEEAKSRQVVGV